MNFERRPQTTDVPHRVEHEPGRSMRREHSRPTRKSSRKFVAQLIDQLRCHGKDVAPSGQQRYSIPCPGPSRLWPQGLTGEGGNHFAERLVLARRQRFGCHENVVVDGKRGSQGITLASNITHLASRRSGVKCSRASAHSPLTDPFHWQEIQPTAPVRKCPPGAHHRSQ